jgi:hypothetical protein
MAVPRTPIRRNALRLLRPTRVDPSWGNRPQLDSARQQRKREAFANLAIFWSINARIAQKSAIVWKIDSTKLYAHLKSVKQ